MSTRIGKPLLRYLAILALLMPVVVIAASHTEGSSRSRLIAETSEAFQGGDTLAVRFAGRIQSQQPGPDRLVFDGPMRSLATGEPLGQFTWDLTCAHAAGFPCGQYEVTNTFRFAKGTIVTRGTATIAPDPSEPGQFHAGIHPASVIETTGAFAGRTGTAHMSGRHNGKEFPAFVTFDDFWLIELD